MAFHLYEDTWETSTTTGTGAYTLAGAVSGWRPFSAQYANGDTCLYSAYDGANFEMGIGTFSTSGPSLARTTIYRSSNANAAVPWSAGTRQIVVAPLGVSLEALLTPGTLGRPRKTADNAWSFDAIGQDLGIAGSALATSGNIGELIKGSFTNVAQVNGAVTNIGSISVPPGDWNIDGNIFFGNVGATTYTLIAAGWSTVSATMGNQQQIQINFQLGDANELNTSSGDLQLSSTTTVFLVGSASFSGTAATYNGTIRARRMR